MTDDMVPTSESERATLDDEARKKWAKKEQKLLEQLREAQEAEARALDRFRRVQARLQRRKARIERLKGKLLQLRQESVEQHSAAVKANGMQDGAALLDGLQGTVPIEVAPVEIEWGQESAAEIGNGGHNGWVEWTPDAPSSEESSPAEGANSTAEEAESSRDIEPVATPVMIEDNEEVEGSDVSQGPTAALPKLEGGSVEGGNLAAADGEGMESAGDISFEVPAATTDVQRLEPDLEPTPTKEEEQSELHKLIDAGVPLSLIQIAAKAKKEWVTAETAVQQARNVAHGIAAGIGFLTQTDISNELMQELLRKQGEANRVLVKVQETARLAYARFIQAQEAAEAASIRQEDQENGFLPTTMQEVADATMQMHAIHLRKEY